MGKTTLSSLIIKYLVEHRKKVVLAVDADPNSNLHLKLGVEVERTLGDLREELVSETGPPAGMTKQQYTEYQLNLAKTEGEKFDLLVMGRPEGPGCYCYVNNLLRTFLDKEAEKYDYVVIDNEAGMEHLSRRTARRIDILFIVSSPTKIGINTAVRISDLVGEMGLDVGKTVLLINNAPSASEQIEQIKDLAGGKFDRVHRIPSDSAVVEFENLDKSLLGIPEDSIAYTSLKRSLQPGI